MKLVTEYGKTIKVCAYSLVTISAMLAIGTLTRLSGIDATLGLAFAGAGRTLPVLRPVAGLARRLIDRLRHRLEHPVRQPAESTSEQLGLTPILTGAANSRAVSWAR